MPEQYEKFWRYTL